MNSYVIGLMIIGCIFIFSTGCTDSGKINQTVPPTQEQGLVSSSVWDGQVTQPPKELSASVSADEDAITHQITVTYNGGGGQQLIKDLQARFLMNNGQVEVRPLGTKKGDSVSVQGTDKPDRVQVVVSIMGGNTYKIYDMVLNEKNRVT